MGYRSAFSHPGVVAALAAALLFGAATPLAKSLLQVVNPWLLAGLLYLGSGLGLTLYRLVNRAPRVRRPPDERKWFAGAVLSGGIVGPVLLMYGLTGASAADASLLLNAEGVFTALLAWFIFKENFDRRIALGMIAIVAGALVLSWPGESSLEASRPSLAILGACLAWGVGAALILGLLSYGISLVFFVVALRHLGTARTGAYFSVAPFFGALLALLMGAPLTLPLLLAGLLMAIGVWLHLSENHAHQHTHQRIEHCHEHEHDEHHTHSHDAAAPIGDRHSHRHVHEAITHTHPHYPDAHHSHRH